MGSMDTFKQTAPVHKLKGNGIKVRGSPIIQRLFRGELKEGPVTLMPQTSRVMERGWGLER